MSFSDSTPKYLRGMHICSLPVEIVQMIVKYLVDDPRAYFSFALTCRALRFVTISIPVTQFPWLLYHGRNTRKLEKELSYNFSDFMHISDTYKYQFRRCSFYLPDSTTRRQYAPPLVDIYWPNAVTCIAFVARGREQICVPDVRHLSNLRQLEIYSSRLYAADVYFEGLPKSCETVSAFNCIIVENGRNPGVLRNINNLTCCRLGSNYDDIKHMAILTIRPLDDAAALNLFKLRNIKSLTVRDCLRYDINVPDELEHLCLWDYVGSMNGYNSIARSNHVSFFNSSLISHTNTLGHGNIKKLELTRSTFGVRTGCFDSVLELQITHCLILIHENDSVFMTKTPILKKAEFCGCISKNRNAGMLHLKAKIENECDANIEWTQTCE